MREHPGGRRRIADEIAVRAAIGETEHGCRVCQHFMQRVAIAVGITEEWLHQQGMAVTFQKGVVVDIDRIPAGGLCDAADRFFRAGLIVDRVSQKEGSVEIVMQMGREGFFDAEGFQHRVAFGDQCRAQGRIAHCPRNRLDWLADK